jgi:hypothetical protein
VVKPSPVNDHEIVETTWVHGHSGRLQATTGFTYEWLGFFLRLKAETAGETWVHYSLPYLSGEQTRFAAGVAIQMRTWGGGSIQSVHLWDGSTRLAASEAPLRSLVGTQLRERESGDALVTVNTDIEPPVPLSSAIGVSILVVAESVRDAVAIAAVGVRLPRSWV